eukprot:CAMPEP_0117028548 /NCGR_PEP_ID=MMETSP0472-20121206/20748_1 /TAXON_ID=693140 ORGANISM="Tiarina fusus, Strain LIS" /NCGR_SAMPLE_ID=MMETSP0472 /ASSEMBLY_ACC=CAM_ASM_000603 /LENGTH=200 /DNA_ID=CAMNT_0004736067 /DNA_START=83 /DNA_END=685 /DNA_ORIENTATION=+
MTALCLVCLAEMAVAFVPGSVFSSVGNHAVLTRQRQQRSTTTTTWSTAESSKAVDDDEASMEIDLDIFDEQEEHRVVSDDAASSAFDAHEQVWRYAKKPLLHIGSKGATHSHGNSLRQLLNDHTVVKVKVNTKKFGTLEKAATALKSLAVENGACKDIEIIQIREYGNTILFGVPGTLKRMKDGEFPPPTPPPAPEELSP